MSLSAFERVFLRDNDENCYFFSSLRGAKATRQSPPIGTGAKTQEILALAGKDDD
ncbi:MAG: hypothetical protein IJ824_02640 [Alphaproteobacteria bacterium]|nr:hypothetical protein [Alphaproteobacteria bacterium]